MESSNKQPLTVYLDGLTNKFNLSRSLFDPLAIQFFLLEDQRRQTEVNAPYAFAWEPASWQMFLDMEELVLLSAPSQWLLCFLTLRNTNRTFVLRYSVLIECAGKRSWKILVDQIESNWPTNSFRKRAKCSRQVSKPRPSAVLWLCPVITTPGRKSFKHRLQRPLVTFTSDHVASVTSSQFYNSLFVSSLPGDFCALSLVAVYHWHHYIIPERPHLHSYYICKHRNHVSFSLFSLVV